MLIIAEAFLRELFAPALQQQGYISLWTQPSSDSIHVHISDISTISKICYDLVDHSDIYFGLSLRRSDLGRFKRGKRKDLFLSTALWIDVDLSSSAHAAKNLPTTVEQALTLVQEALPSLPWSSVVHSGHGLHIYWFLDEPYFFDSGIEPFENVVEELQQRVVRVSSERGWHVDITADAARVLRVPGTVNRKLPQDLRQVELVGGSCVRYKFSEIEKLLLGEKIVKSSTEATSPCAPHTAVATVDDFIILSREQIEQRLRVLKKQETRELALKVLSGQPFANPGERDKQLYRLCSILAFLSPGSTPINLFPIIETSLAAVQAAHNDPSNPAPTNEEALDKLDHALEDIREKKRQEKTQDNGIRNALIRQARKEPGDSEELVTEYTNEELVEFATSQKCSLEEFKKRWVVQKGTAFYIFVNGNYESPIVKDELLISLRRDLAPVPAVGPAAIQWLTKKADGGLRQKKVAELLDDCSVVARRLIADLRISKSYYQPETQTFYEACCALRSIKPRRNAQIEEWLYALGGQDTDKLLDWVATVTLLDRQTCAIYFSGKKGAGKSLFAVGLSRIWTEGAPTELGRVLENFNSDLLRCPLIFADERLPQNWKGQRTSAQLRQLIGSDSRTLTRKFIPNADLLGAVRLILAANNERMLSLDEDLGADDLDAVGQRFLHIEATQKAVDLLQSFGGRTGTDKWVSGDQIAAHALWLRDTRSVTYGDRFLVEGRQTRMHQSLPIQERTNGLICEWITQYLNASSKVTFPLEQTGTVFAGNGELLLNVLALKNGWRSFIASDPVPTTTRLGRALGTLALGEKRINNNRFHIVNIDLVYQWADQNQVGDLERMKHYVNRPFSPEDVKKLFNNLSFMNRN